MGENSSIEWTHHTFNPWIGCTKVSPGCANCYAEAQDHRWGHDRHLDWVIVGGESGHGARAMDLAWARSLRDQCRSARVAFFFKQVGAELATASAKGGTYADIPPDLFIREFPEALIHA